FVKNLTQESKLLPEESPVVLRHSLNPFLIASRLPAVRPVTPPIGSAGGTSSHCRWFKNVAGSSIQPACHCALLPHPSTPRTISAAFRSPCAFFQALSAAGRCRFL